MQALAKVKDINGIQYLISADTDEGEAITLQRASEFYGKPITELVNYRIVEALRPMWEHPPEHAVD